MGTMNNDLLAKINAVGTAKAQAENNEWNVALTRNNELRKEISILAPRAKVLIDLANACVANKIEIGFGIRHDVIWHGITDKYFLTDGVHHTIGFDFDRNMPIQRIGMEGTGSCCWSFMNLYADGRVECDAHEHTWNRTRTQAMANENGILERFLKGFDKFERRFKEYIESL